MKNKQFSLLQEGLEAGKDLLFPYSCPVCSVLLPVAGDGLCDNCLQSVARIQSPLCPVCGREMSDSALGDHLCGTCLAKKPPFLTASAVSHYQEPVSSLLQSLKYQGDTTVLPALQGVINLYGPIVLAKEDRIIPVPLHTRRLRQRGFNQAVLIARLFFPGETDRILLDSLQRIRHTAPQAGLDGMARRKNLRNAFIVRNTGELKGRKVILVDDVFTTGTTVAECSRALLGAGAREVSVLTVARVRE